MKLKDISTIVSGGTPSTLIENYWNGDIPWITPKDLSKHNKVYISNGERFISEEGLRNSSACIIPKGSLIFSSRAPIGYVAIAENELCTNQGFKNFVCDRKVVNNIYLYYWLLNNREVIESYASGSTFKEISGSKISEINIELPSLENQNKIVKILISLDSKIELNNKINDNLYNILVTLYKEELLNSENANIKTLDEFCNIFTGKKNANQYDENGQYKFFTCGDKELRINSYIYDGPSIIISGNGAYTGRTTFYNGRYDLYQRTYACTIKDSVDKDFIYGLYIIIKNDLGKTINGGTHGSAIPYIVMDDLAKFKLNYDENIFKLYSKKAKIILDKIQRNNEENDNLKKLRDTLLPKLFNGEIDLDSIEV